MLQPVSPADRELCHSLLLHPSHHDLRYTGAADRALREILFRSLTHNHPSYLRLLFPHGPPPDRSRPWSLKEAQGAQEGAEYTAAAKGTACGHIFKSGESTYHCKTCAADDTCVLCMKCFESSDHEGHNVFISVSPGNSGCCDCGDREAWKRECRCSIHTAGMLEQDQERQEQKAKGKVEQLPLDLVESIRTTIARSVDYLCDVFSCSPDNLRIPKSENSIRRDERSSHLGMPYGEEPPEPQGEEYALLLWNDEKHTVDDVQNQVARACSQTKRFGREKAYEVDGVGRSVVKYSRDLKELLKMAEIIEQIKVTVTIRSSRDTFREQMCATIIDWISDISGCSVGNDPYILRNTICEELLKPWRTGSPATNLNIGQAGIDDHEFEENEKSRRQVRVFMQPFQMQQPAATATRVAVQTAVPDDDNGDDDDNDDEEEEDEYDEMDVEEDGMEIEVDDLRQAASVAMAQAAQAVEADMEMDYIDDNEDVTEVLEATLAGYPPPPPPPPQQQDGASQQRRRILTPADSEDGDAAEVPRLQTNAPYNIVPRTPKAKNVGKRSSTRPSRHWLEKPAGMSAPRPTEPCEDLYQRVRLDFLILYDLRLWKSLRTELRHLYITTVVTIPNFKRILGLRFAGLYTALAQLYLIADREPDHSIINLSVQMLTTPSITEEVVERGNFLSNLMALLYTFLTTRQVGFPEDVNPKATLAFDAGAVTNRRMFHFFMDLKWLFQSEYIHYKTRTEPRYLLQFLDLVKLHQGVCPNVRATGEHVEYESDTWISASMIVKEVNKVCKQVAISFAPKAEVEDGDVHLRRALRTVAQVTMINSFGYERKRFIAAELKDDLAWHTVSMELKGAVKRYSVPKYVVQSEPMSFHHPLHYLLSWLLEEAKGMSREEVRSLLHFSSEDLKDPWNVSRTQAAPSSLTSDELLCSIFDHPLRTYVWLAQMKAGMWVRNGITLRHQMHTYRSVSHRDLSYQRDVLMIQAGLVLCGTETEMQGERFLAQMLDRFEITRWMQGDYAVLPGYEQSQQLDVLEDFFHLLVTVLSERGHLVVHKDPREANERSMMRDIAHALCFKPLSFSDLRGRISEKIADTDEYQRLLPAMTVYRPPEGLNDTGTFELKPDFIELVDPYYAHYSRNHREEAENIYKKHMAQKTGKKVDDIVFEPRLLSLDGSLFAGLTAFTRTPVFLQVVASALNYAIGLKTIAPKVQATRMETFLHMVLYLMLLAVVEDKSGGEDGFTALAATLYPALAGQQHVTVVSMLLTLSSMDEYAAVHPTIKHILRKIQLRFPEKLNTATGALGAAIDRADGGSPASLSADDKEKKKQEALARQARVMAKMKEQQNSFLQNQGLSAFGDDFDDLDDMSITDEADQFVEARKTWSFPSGTCILCQEDTDDQRLYGTFAYLGESGILRSTPVNDPDFVKEVINTPASLDRPADDIRPFGVAGDNKRTVQKTTSDGQVISFDRQGLSKGFPQQKNGVKGPVSTSCGHIMHFGCFELYLAATQRRHHTQIARNHPERIELKEFICPLCKALGNTFVPIIWKAKECAYEHELHAAKNLNDYLTNLTYTADLSFLDSDTNAAAIARQQQVRELYASRSSHYVNSMFAPSLLSSLQDLSLESPTTPQGQQHRASRSYSLSSLFGIGRRRGSHSNDAQEAGFSAQGEQQPRMAELVKAYHRIDETIRANRLCPVWQIEEGIVNPVGPLSSALGLSISAFEIAHRGAAADPIATSLLHDLSEQNLTHLRILSETVESFLAVNVLNPRLNTVAQEAVKKRDIMAAKLFGVESEISMIKLRDQGEKLLLEDDSFLFFADWLSFMAPNVAEASSILQLCYWAELVKAIFVYKRVVKDQPYTNSAPPVSEAFKLAVSGMAMEDIRERYVRVPLSDQQLPTLRLVVDKYATAFLRKAIVLMHVRYGLDFECPYDIDVEAPEAERLTKLLHMPTVDDICTLYTAQGTGSDRLRLFTKRWMSQANNLTEHEEAGHTTIAMPHPAIFELVGLPKNYDTLTEEAIKRKCPNSGKEVIDPAVCLFCGDIFCSQAVCCMKDKNKGGCFQHMQKCGGKIGLFINIRKCMVLFMHGPGNGSWAHAPYLDKHGEPDPTLRRHHQLYLHQRRYDKLYRDTWLQHMIPTVISRKLEADINPGGWETL